MILIVSATYNEIAPLLPKNIEEGIVTPLYYPNTFALVSGIGATATTYHLLSAILKNKITHVINIGVAGSYKPQLAIGDLVVVEKETFADYGIDDNGKLLSLFEVGLSNPDKKPYKEGWMHWPYNQLYPPTQNFPKAKGVTVATTSGSPAKIQSLEEKYSPDIETMEGAAVFYTCLMTNTPFLCLRGISNAVEIRDKEKWDLPLAIKNLCNAAEKIIQNIA